MKQHRANGKNVIAETWIGLNKVEVKYNDFSKATYDKKTFDLMHKTVSEVAK